MYYTRHDNLAYGKFCRDHLYIVRITSVSYQQSIKVVYHELTDLVHTFPRERIRRECDQLFV